MRQSAIIFAVGLLAVTAVSAQEQKIGAPPEAKNMRLVGYSDLQDRSAYQPTIFHQGDRYIAYIGHHGGTPDVPKPINTLTGKAEFNGTSILDVTDPAQPKYLHHIPGEPGEYEAGGAQMVRVCAGSTLPKADTSKFYLLRTFGEQRARDLGRDRSGQARAHHARRRASRTRIRAGGNATPASPIWCPARRAGAPAA